ncbi:hypothetical protein J3E69DRAFT_378851 [Trichoderma sp. SZMC 28015]
MTDFAIGIVSQGIQVCSVIATYISTLKDRDEDLAAIDRQAQGLESVFRALKESLTQGSLDASTSPAAAQVLSFMQTCEAELNSLKELAAHLSDSTSPNARPHDKIKQQVKKSYSCLATSKLSNLEAATQQASSSFAALGSDISTLHTKLDELLDRLQQNNTVGAAALDEDDPMKAIYKLAYKPSCKYFRSNGDERRRVRVLRVTGLVKNAVIISLCTSTGAGGQSLGANLEYRATVDWMVSPAFRVISVLENCAKMVKFICHRPVVQQIKDQVQWTKLILSASHKLEYLFRLGKASAKDAYEIYWIMDWHGEIAEIGEAYSPPIAHLATFLVKRQASASLLDLDGRQALSIANPREPLSLPLIEAFYTCDEDIHDSDSSHDTYRFKTHQKLAQTFSRYATMLKVADAFHGPLSMAVISNDQVQICRLLRTYPECLEERAYYSGRTPLHLAVGYPECLQILVERSDPSHLVQKDNYSLTVLGYAIHLSETLCGQRENQDESSCRCTLPLRILLEGGCPIIPYRDFKSFVPERAILDGSKHCKIYLAKSLLQRRQKLKFLAQQYLSPIEIDSFNLHRPATLDIYATRIDEILRERGYTEFGPLATYVQADIVRGSPIQDNRSIYHELCTVEDANIYFNLGFHDITAGIDLTERWEPIVYGIFPRLSLPFVKWLLDHDAPLCEWMQNFFTPWTGYIADAFVLAILLDKAPLNGYAREGDEELVRELEERMLMDDSVDSCNCRCSPRGCTPFVKRLKRIESTGDEIDIATILTTYLKEYGNALRREHYCAAIRFTTFDALGIAHTCRCRPHYERRRKLDAEEIAEIQNEYAELLELLESPLMRLRMDLTA